MEFTLIKHQNAEHIYLLKYTEQSISTLGNGKKKKKKRTEEQVQVQNRCIFTLAHQSTEWYDARASSHKK